MEKSISKINNILKNKESKISFIFPSKKFINELKVILLNNGLIEDNINIIIEIQVLILKTLK